VIVLPKTTKNASAIQRGNAGNRWFISTAALNRVNVREPRVLYPALSRGGGSGWTRELLKRIGHLAGIQLLNLGGGAGPAWKHALRAESWSAFDE